MSDKFHDGAQVLSAFQRKRLEHVWKEQRRTNPPLENRALAWSIRWQHVWGHYGVSRISGLVRHPYGNRKPAQVLRLSAVACIGSAAF